MDSSGELYRQLKGSLCPFYHRPDSVEIRNAVIESHDSENYRKQFICSCLFAGTSEVDDCVLVEVH
jgi:hypothetical protein